MKIKYIIGLIVLIIIILGFAVASFLPKLPFCTKMGCPCENLVSERPCNSCIVSNPIFTLGIVHISKTCSAQEVILCENNLDVGTRIDIDKDSCKYKLSSLSY